MHQEIGTLRTQLQDAAQAVPLPQEMHTSLVDTRLLGKPESFDRGIGCKNWSVVFRSYACACSALLGLLLECTERSAAQRDADAVRSIVLDNAVLHAGDVVQGCCSDTSGTVLADTQCGSVARALELQLRGRDGGSNGTVRPRDRYEKASGETFPENIRIGVALRMLPDGPLEQHLVLNSAR